MTYRTQTDIAALKRLLSLVRLEKAVIGFTDEQLEAMNGRNRYMADDTAEIREAMRLYRESWIEAIIEALLRGDNRELRQLL